MSEPDDFVPEIKLGLITIPVLSSNFCTDPETGENPVMDAVRSMIAEVSKHTHEKVLLASQLICAQAGVRFSDVSVEELNFAVQEAARIGIKSFDEGEMQEIYRAELPDNEGNGAS